MPAFNARIALAHRYLVLVVFIFFAACQYAQGDSSTPEESLSHLWIKAISNDDVSFFNSLLKSDAKPEPMIGLAAPNGKTALMVASKKGDLSLVKALHRKGAKVNRVTQTGGTAFMFAVLGNNLDVAQWLAKENANVAAAGSNGWSAATIAAAMGHTEILKWLTTLQSSFDSPDVYRFTPLMRAVDNRHYAAAKILLETQTVDVNVRDEWENTPLHFAMANKDEKMLELLLSHGARMSNANRDGVSPNTMLDEWPEAHQVVDRFR